MSPFGVMISGVMPTKVTLPTSLTTACSLLFSMVQGKRHRLFSGRSRSTYVGIIIIIVCDCGGGESFGEMILPSTRRIGIAMSCHHMCELFHVSSCT
mmetsp:Transcript_22568/g.28999  ORF Transcript_22568/g.28999 Transcript_22568/m.28999 type:complete len:97 (+) Transcript_22568:126-416(+)